MDHTSGTAGAEVKDLSTKKAVIADQDFMMMDLNGDGVDCGGVEHVDKQ